MLIVASMGTSPRAGRNDQDALPAVLDQSVADSYVLFCYVDDDYMSEAGFTAGFMSGFGMGVVAGGAAVVGALWLMVHVIMAWARRQ